MVRRSGGITAIEVKSGLRAGALSGMAAFVGRHQPERRLPIGADAVGLEEFLSSPAPRWLA